jgi:predicted phosphoribosyltransferase
MALFVDRVEAGRELAAHLDEFAGRGDVLVLGLARGGVPVAAEVARAIGEPLDVLVVRKGGAPGHEELALGAVGSGGVLVLNDEVVLASGIGVVVQHQRARVLTDWELLEVRGPTPGVSAFTWRRGAGRQAHPRTGRESGR